MGSDDAIKLFLIIYIAISCTFLVYLGVRIEHRITVFINEYNKDKEIEAENTRLLFHNLGVIYDRVDRNKKFSDTQEEQPNSKIWH